MTTRLIRSKVERLETKITPDGEAFDLIWTDPGADRAAALAAWKAERSVDGIPAYCAEWQLAEAGRYRRSAGQLGPCPASRRTSAGRISERERDVLWYALSADIRRIRAVDADDKGDTGAAKHMTDRELISAIIYGFADRFDYSAQPVNTGR